MKNKIILVSALFISILFISACSNSAEDEEVSETTDPEETTTASSEIEDKEANDNSESLFGDLDLPEDQLGLSIGDTAHYKYGYQDIIREFEITLNSVEISDTAGDQPSEEGNYVIVNVTLKNLSEVPVIAEDGLSLSLENENVGGLPWFYIEGVAEEWPGEIPPNESQTGVLLYDSPTGTSYSLISGDSSANANTISFEFTEDEAE
ncbi:DUF4352 domain-containing protein [Gracilibacillus caseinilyticus]|uniref:DUF4352 domain-containing protein n=1 Tax=Gracilibacillus caseinilyticus TaxID=2932256 RepID=A0ABY4F5Q2_9BACI|nr:DUF4352 domain-containing protein [Gracilibacillus caseinilyticus]UOQ49796.1 DUF4352 domain-containing protein [Gracilibacillus caseinilyticus]